MIDDEEDASDALIDFIDGFDEDAEPSEEIDALAERFMREGSTRNRADAAAAWALCSLRRPERLASLREFLASDAEDEVRGAALACAAIHADVALLETHARDASPVLRKAVAEHAGRWLTARRGHEAQGLALVRGLLADEDEDVWREAITALRGFCDRPGATGWAVLDALIASDDAERREHAQLVAVREILGVVTSAAVDTAVLVRWLSAEWDLLRRVSAETWPSVVPHPGVEDLRVLDERLRAETEADVVGALFACAARWRFVEAFRSRLAHPSAEVRAELASAASRLEDGAPIAISLCRDADERVRAAAIRALGAFAGTPGVAPPRLDVTGDAELEATIDALDAPWEALDATAFFAGLVEHPSTPVRRAAASALPFLAARWDALDGALAAFLRDGDPAVCEAAARGLNEVQRRRHRARFREIVALAAQPKVEERPEGGRDIFAFFEPGYEKPHGLFCLERPPGDLRATVGAWALDPSRVLDWSHGAVGDDLHGEDVFGLLRERRTSMGHITLAAPVLHPWAYRGQGSCLQNLLDMTPGELEQVRTGAVRVVVDPGAGPLYPGFFVHAEFDEAGVETGTGVPAIQRLLQGLDVHMAAVLLEQDIERSTHARRRARWERRLAWLRALVDQHVRAEHLVLTELPVLPAALRVDPAPGGLDARYRRVLEANASGEPLALQDAVNALFGLASPND
jgi:hypothetical protein